LKLSLSIFHINTYAIPQKSSSALRSLTNKRLSGVRAALSPRRSATPRAHDG
jgi:hypothetical protein